MKMNSKDVNLVHEFIMRELREFPAFVSMSMKQQIETEYRYLDEIAKVLRSYTHADYYVIESLSNLGLVERSLKLTPTDHTYECGTIITMLLPPSATRGRISHSIKRKEKS